jgi:hypothetical protein
MLFEEERARLRTLIGQGVAPARPLTHARILLKANQGEAGPGWTDAAIGAALEVHPASVARIRQRYVASTGGSPPRMPASSSSTSTQQSRTDDLLVGMPSSAAPAGCPVRPVR